MKFEFKHVDGKIILIINIAVWGEDITNEYDVTKGVMPVVDDYLDYHINKELNAFKEKAKGE